MARNKCKELYDKLDKGEWKVEDVTVSTITIKDLEFTKPTMNARENLTVESRKKLESGGTRKERVVFRKYPESDIVIAFFPDTLRDGSCNRGCLMSYEHNGQHSEADLGFYEDCRPCSEREYADLLTELEGIYDDCELVVVDDF